MYEKFLSFTQTPLLALSSRLVLEILQWSLVNEDNVYQMNFSILYLMLVRSALLNRIMYLN